MYLFHRTVLESRCIGLKAARLLLDAANPYRLCQCFSNAGPRPGTGPWHQLYRAARGL